MAAFIPPLTQESFDDARHITYYDNPLQCGISPKWSDQQGLDGRKKSSVRRELNAEEFQRRQDLEEERENLQDTLEQRYALLQSDPADMCREDEVVREENLQSLQ